MKTQQAGFTIVELLIASAVFSVVLLLCTFGLLQIGRSYYKGYVSSLAQETARNILDDVTQTIEFSDGKNGGGGNITSLSGEASGASYVLCIDNTRYSFVIDRQLEDTLTQPDQVNQVLIKDIISNCPSSTPFNALATDHKEYMSAGMRLAKLEVLPVPGSDPTTYKVTVRVIYGGGDLLNSSHDDCAVGSGSQYCAKAELSSVVQPRLEKKGL